jgi:hypothetical protein
VWLERRGYLVGDHEVDVQLRFVGPAPDILTDVTLILDADKFNRAWLRPGEPERVTMVPVWNGGDLTLLFTLRGERTSWQGPALPEGGGYRIALDIDGEGRVEERHCLLPCPPW